MEKSIFATILLWLWAATLFAQSGLEITVVDREDGRPVSNIELIITNQNIGFSETEMTDEQGKVRLTNLSTTGEYVVNIPEDSDYYGLSSDPLELRSNQTRSITMVIASKSTVTLDEITVLAPITRINTINAEVASELSSAELESLPIEARDINKALYRLPNVTPATGFFPEAPTVSINGANSLYTNYLIDGMDNNEQFLGGPKFPIPTGFLQNVTVMTNNYSTEYGLSGNGVFNITTKSGGNELEGEAFYVVRPGAVVDGQSDFAQRDLSGNQVKEGFQRHQFGFGIGGLIKEDKTFYYINAEQIFDLKDNLLSSPQLGVNETVPGQNRFTLLSGRLDHNWGPNFRSSLRVNSGLINIERQGGGLDGGLTFPSAGNSQDRNSFLAALKNSYRIGGWSGETNLQYSRFRWNYSNPNNPDSPAATVLGPSGQTIAVVGNPGFEFDNIENTVQVQQNFILQKNNHTFKVGASVLSANHALLGGGNEFGNYTLQLNQSQLDALRNQNLGSSLNIEDLPVGAQVLNYAVELRPTRFGTNQNIYSFYVEDLYSVNSNLNLTFGLRYDYDNLSAGGGDDGDYNNIAPRFNFNYKLNSRSSFRGGYGIFYDKIVYSVHSDALQQNSTAADFRIQLQSLIDQGILPQDTDLDAVTFNGNVSAGINNAPFPNGPTSQEISADRNYIFSNSLRILNPDGYDNPYTHQFSLGYQRQLGEDKLFYVDLMHSRSENLFRLPDLNAPAPYPLDDPNNVNVRTQQEADLTRPVPIYSDQNGTYSIVDGDTLRGIGRNVVMTETAGQSRYWAASLNLQKSRLDDNFSYRISYTLSQLRNNTEDINFRAQDANNFEDEWGPSINDRTHVISGIFSWYALDGFSVNMATFMQSGQPINRIPDAEVYGTTDLNGDGRAFGDAYVGNSDRSPGESRNSDRLPWATTFDMGIQYQAPFGNGQKLEVRADIFNIFNTQNLSGYANNATQSNQIQVGPADSGLLVRKNASPPRQIQFSIRYLF
ncbi:TonB-dependent receptor domain-containing protein [Gracilimonas sp.]|uniref:TonB-dependent receptor n=1 Tax=Gracilimonas sp. TaxID=1974203 RepID=UPI00287210B8|nr:TonB-dependent receptor [Gracilimonas sp.]